MKYLKLTICVILLTGFIGAILADDADSTVQPPVVSEPEPKGKKSPNSYGFAFETENGQVRDENIKLNMETPSSQMDVNFKGSYSFISADNYEYTVHYKADKKGYRPYVTAHKIKTDKDTTTTD